MAMEYDHIMACQFSAWYPRFSDVAFRSRVIPLPAAFIAYLLQDGVFLPEGSHAMPQRALPLPHDDYESWAEEDPDSDEPAAVTAPEFPELMRDIEGAISELGGCVAPKLNWSSPHDAAWVSADRTLACRSADEVVLLLKSSDRVAHDICHAFDACGGAPGPAHSMQYALALRKWAALRPEREFRCFVSARELVAVSQRDVLAHAPGLQAERQDLLEALLEFFEQHVQQRFPLRDYTFDVYITTAGKVRLLDFNPVFGTTSPLLFDWDELPYGAAGPSRAAADEPAHPHERGQCEAAAPHVSRVYAEPEAWAGGASSIHDHNGMEHVSGVLPSTSIRGFAAGQEPSPAEEGQGRANGHNQPAGQDPSSCEVLFRFAAADTVLRPSTAVYGAPFEMADMREGGAIDALLQRLQVEHQDS